MCIKYFIKYPYYHPVVHEDNKLRQFMASAGKSVLNKGAVNIIGLSFC